MGYTDSNFQLDYDDNKSVVVFVFILNDGAVCSKSSKQQIVADSVCETEYIAAFDVAKEAVWLRKFITELGVASSIVGPVLLFYDSTGAIAQAKEPWPYQHTKHILHRYHLIWEIIEQCDINLQKVKGKDNLAGPFTKALSIKEFNNHK